MTNALKKELATQNKKASRSKTILIKKKDILNKTKERRQKTDK